MSRQNNIEESQELLAEIIQICENDSLLTTEVSDSEDAAVIQGFSRIPESDDDTVSRSEAVDPSNRVIHVKLPSQKLVIADVTRIEFTAPTLRQSYSDASRSATQDSSDSSRNELTDTNGYDLLESTGEQFPSNACRSDSSDDSTKEVADAIDFDLLESIWERSPSEAPRSSTPDSSDRPKEEVAINFELSGSTCGRSHSEESRSSEHDSSFMYSFLAEPDNLFLRYYERGRFLLKTIRRKGYLLPFELIWLALTIASCYMGAYYWPMCPAEKYLPKYVFFNGAIATFSLCVEIMDTLWKLLLRHHVGVGRYFCAFGIGWVALITTLIEMIQFYTMSYSFHRNEENYCNETFYWFVFYKNIAFVVLISLTALIYIPSFDYFLFFLADVN